MKISLPFNFSPRFYQLPFFQAMDSGFKRACLVWHRKSGKTKTLINFSCKRMFERVGAIFHCFPEYGQGRKIIWDGIDDDGFKTTDHIPKALRANTNNTEMKITLKNKSIYQVIGADNYDCYDDKTEILTKEGWRFFKDLSGKEEVATLDNGKMVFSPINARVEYNYCGEMVSVKNNAIDLLITPNHKFYVKSRKGVYKFKQISDRTILNDMIPATSGWDGEEREYFELPKIPVVKYICGKGRRVEQEWNLKFKMEDWCAFMGLFLSEGSTFSDHRGNYRVVISQKIESNISKIEDLFNRMEIKFHYDKKSSNFIIQNKQLYEYCKVFGLCHEKYIPKELKCLSPRLLNILSEWLVIGDGYVAPEFDHLFFYSTSKKLIDDFQEITLKLGYSGNISIKAQNSEAVINGTRVISSSQPLYQFSRRKTEFKYFRDSIENYISKQFYKGKVYCVDAGSHVIKVRRNGYEAWSGNSLVGPNPVGLILDEWAVSDRYRQAWDYFRPILASNGGWAVFVYTPRGRNHGWDTYQMALRNPEWFCQLLTADDTKAISREAIDSERKSGMSETMIQQEFYCSFLASVEDILIPFELIQEALRRETVPIIGATRVAGLDVARFGDDRNALVIRQAGQIIFADAWGGVDTVYTAGKAIDLYKTKLFDTVAVDTIGLGAGVFDMLRNAEVPAVPVVVSEKANEDGRFMRLRDELWWKVREWFSEGGCSISPGINEEMKKSLISDIQDVRYSFSPKGLITVERKEEMKERLGYSPDLGDALCCTFSPMINLRLRPFDRVPYEIRKREENQEQTYDPLRWGL